MKSNVRETHKLTDIKGIGEVRTQWLHEVNINTVPALLAMPAREIETSLKSNGHSISFIEIKDWQAQAQKMLAAEYINNMHTQIEPKAVLKSTEGKTFATFVVEFQRLPSGKKEQVQTLVHHMEGGEAGGGKSKKWEGLAGSELCDWMNKQIDEKYLMLKESISLPKPFAGSEAGEKQAIKGTRPLPATPLPPPTATLSIRDAELIQQPDDVPVQLDETGHMFIYPVHSKTPFDLHVVFELMGKLGGNNGSIQRFSTQAYATNKTTGETILLGESEPQPSIPSQPRQMVKLPGIRLQQGLYRLQLIVRGMDQPGILGFLEVPVLQVV